MKYTGKKVLHKAKYGEGIIVSEDYAEHITVYFPSQKCDKKFPVPKCFATHLQLLDANIEEMDEVSKDILNKEKEEKEAVVVKKEKTLSS